MCDLKEDYCYVVIVASDIVFPRLDYINEIFSRLEYYWTPSFEEHCFSPEIVAFLFTQDNFHHKTKGHMYSVYYECSSWNLSCLIDSEKFFFGVVRFLYWPDMQSAHRASNCFLPVA